MMYSRELISWLNNLPADTPIGMSDGGVLIATEDGENWIEIGGLPEGSAGAEL